MNKTIELLLQQYNHGRDNFIFLFQNLFDLRFQTFEYDYYDIKVICDSAYKNEFRVHYEGPWGFGEKNLKEFLYYIWDEEIETRAKKYILRYL